MAGRMHHPTPPRPTPPHPPTGLQVCPAFGGLRKYDQTRQLKEGVEVVVATPGRLLDLLKEAACTMKRATYLVLDEADRMFEMGFEPQVGWRHREI